MRYGYLEASEVLLIMDTDVSSYIIRRRMPL